MIINISKLVGQFITESINNVMETRAKELGKSKFIQENETGATVGSAIVGTGLGLLTGSFGLPVLLAGLLAGSVVGAGSEKVIKKVFKEVNKDGASLQGYVKKLR